MKLLVTGGAGFIGANFIQYVIDRPEIEQLINMDCLTYAGHLENLAGPSRSPKYVFERVDIREREQVRRVFREHQITHVIHLAAESHVDRSIASPGDFITTNIFGTYNLLEACRESWTGSEGGDRRRFHHVSTDEVYGSLGPDGFFTETTPCAPNSPYSASKASSDMLVRAYHKTYGLDVVITRCSNNYGPYQFPEKLIPVVIQRLIERKPVPIYGDGLHVRDWLFVRDHADALWQVLTRGRSGEVYNIAGNNEWPNLEMAKLVCDLFDELRPEAGGNSRNLIMFVEDRPGHDRRYAIDASKIEGDLAWKPAHTFEDGIRETLAWYLANQEWMRTVAGGG